MLSSMMITLGRAADGGQQLLEPLDLDVDGGIDPQALAEASLVEELEGERGGRHPGEVGTLLEVVIQRLLRRREQREPEVLSCVT